MHTQHAENSLSEVKRSNCILFLLWYYPLSLVRIHIKYQFISSRLAPSRNIFMYSYLRSQFNINSWFVFSKLSGGLASFRPEILAVSGTNEIWQQNDLWPQILEKMNWFFRFWHFHELVLTSSYIRIIHTTIFSCT